MADDALAFWGNKRGLGGEEMGKNGVLKRDVGYYMERNAGEERPFTPGLFYSTLLLRLFAIEYVYVTFCF
jgi:hypothetical protein